jgi:glycosyltransferase involved in cell wall biosynthesis
MMEETLKGGQRLHGDSPAQEAGLPVVSIITVVFNGLSLIEKTIKSVISQTWPNIEYIVIDGGSTDGTVEILRLYDHQMSYWISEPDKGIYDAMNKGLAAATGDYVWFMNAGDLIYSPETTEKIFSGTKADRKFEPLDERKEAVQVDQGGKPDFRNLASIYYGDAMIVDAGYHEVGLRRLRPPENLTWKSFRKGMLVCHQAILVSREIVEPFDPQYRHSADYDWVLRALIKAQGSRRKAQGKAKGASLKAQEKSQGARLKAQDTEPMVNPRLQSGDIVNTNLVLCAFLDGGHSKQNIGISLKERFHSMVRHYGWVPTVLWHVPIGFKFGWYYFRHKRF